MSVEIFNYETTYKTDYQRQPYNYISEPKRETYDVLKNLPQIKKMIKIDSETLCPFKENAYIPSDLYFREKPAVQTDPMKKFSKSNYQRITSEQRINARNTRPRVYMVPQVCMDDIPIDVMYGHGGLVDSIYTSDWAKLVELAAPSIKIWPEINTTLENDKEPVRFKPSHPCTPLRLGLHSKAMQWDKKKLRAGVEVDPAKTFWLKNRNKVICTVCEPQSNKLLTNDESKEIKRLVNENKLSLSYDLMMPGYTGHIPKVARGVQPKCKQFTRTEPWVTTYMTLQGNFKQI